MILKIVNCIQKMESRQGIVLEYTKPDIIKVSETEDVEVVDTKVSKFFTLDEIKSIIEAKERQNLSSRLCYYKKKKAATEAALKTVKSE